MGELPDVQVGDVWEDCDLLQHGRTVLVTSLCVEVSACRWGPVPHAHVVAAPSGRHTRIAVRRFKPNQRGYRLVSRLTKEAPDAG